MTFEAFVFVELWIIFIIFICNFIRVKEKMKSQKFPERHFDGRIMINTKDPDKDVFRLEYNGNIMEIPTKEYVTFQIVREDL